MNRRFFYAIALFSLLLLRADFVRAEADPAHRADWARLKKLLNVTQNLKDSDPPAVTGD